MTLKETVEEDMALGPDVIPDIGDSAGDLADPVNQNALDSEDVKQIIETATAQQNPWEN